MKISLWRPDAFRGAERGDRRWPRKPARLWHARTREGCAVIRLIFLSLPLRLPDAESRDAVGNVEPARHAGTAADPAGAADAGH